MSAQTRNTREAEEQLQPQQKPKVIDIGANLTLKAFRSKWRSVVQRAVDAGVDRVILTGLSIQSSEECLQMAQTWYEESNCPNLYTTVGLHPCRAAEWDGKKYSNEESMQRMMCLLQHPFALAVGECGLDYFRNTSPSNIQIHAFRQQLKIAIRLNKPVFLHERDAHDDMIQILDEELEILKVNEGENATLPPIVVHCFTGTEEEALAYIERGLYIGFTGTICKSQRGRHLRDIIPKLPLDKIMIETDAPFMGFKKGRRGSEPADCLDVARKLSETMQLPFETVCEATMETTKRFFRIPE